MIKGGGASTAPSALLLVGYGRSGSTIIGSALGSHPRLFHAGELLWLPRRLKDPERYCSCGSLLAECDFWLEVLDKLAARCGPRAIADLGRLSDQFDHRRWTWTHALRALASKSSEAAEHAALNLALYNAIAQVSGADTVVDTSKLPARALLLATADPVGIRIMHLIRGHRSAIASLKRKHKKDPRAGIPQDRNGRSAAWTSAAWLRRNLECEALAARTPKATFRRVRYEEFINDPKCGLSAVAEFLGIEPEAFSTKINVREQHIFAGNRIRMQGFLSLEPKTINVDHLPAHDRVIGDALTALGRWHYKW